MLTLRRPEGRTERRRNWTVWGIYAACAVVFGIFVNTTVLVVGYSIHQANRFAQATEAKLIQREFQREVDEAARYQSEISYWDAAVSQVRAHQFNTFFVQRHLKDGLWHDYGFSWIIVSDGIGGSRLAIRNGQVTFPAKGNPVVSDARDLVAEARAKYYRMLMPVGDDFEIMAPSADRDLLRAPVPNIHAADIRMIDGKMSIVVAQAIVPQNHRIPNKYKQPVFLVTIKPFSARMLAQMQAGLGISGLAFIPASSASDPAGAYLPVGTGSGRSHVVTWTPNAPGQHILAAATPRAVILAILAAASMIFVAYRFSTLVRALQESEKANRFLAKHDGLTGLANRMSIDEHLQRLANRPGSGFAVIALDLDRFKCVNDRHGHAAGDAVLREMANRFGEKVGRLGVVARLGGDEFVILIEDMKGAGDLMELASALVLSAQHPVLHENLPLRVGCSAGVALFPEHGNNARGILQAADMALYAAKNGGRNRAVLASQTAIPRESLSA